MRAIVLEEFGRMAVVEVDDPDAPPPGHLTVAIEYSGICGTDVHGFAGANGRRVAGQIMGHEASGTITAVGDGVQLAVGTAVTKPRLTTSRTQRSSSA